MRPSILTLVSLLLFLFSYARGRYALIGRFAYHVTPEVSASRDTGSLTCTFPVSISRDSYCTCMCHGDPPGPSLCHAYIFLLMLLTHPVMSTRLLSRTSLCPCVFRTTRLLPVPVLLAPSLLPNDFTSHTLTRLDTISILYSFSSYTCLYLYRTDLYIYWVGDGTIPIFNLLCNHPSVVT